MNLTKSLIALLISFVIVALVLYGLVPGFIKMAQRFELLFVNSFHMSFNSGALAYAFVAAAVFIWALWALRSGKNLNMIKVSFFLAVTISGMLFLGSGWVIGLILSLLLAAWLFFDKRPLPLRALNVIMWSIAVIFIGYSSYALILIRSSADTPMNQNSPDNVFDLATYLNREQYGENPLIYGETFYSGVQKKYLGSSNEEIGQTDENGKPITISYPSYKQLTEKGRAQYSKGVKGAQPADEDGFLTGDDKAANARLAERDGDYYVKSGYKPEMKMNPELDMLFPRIYSRMHRDSYRTWVTLDTTAANMKELYAVDANTGEKVPELDLGAQPNYNPMSGQLVFPQKMGYRPTYVQNLEYFFNYQLIHMYMRYFMWNFAGRQNDLLNQNGELDAGNWISGIPFIDNARLGDQSLLPDDLGKRNQGHNVYYFLPLILGLIGLIWQSFSGKRGIEQFWVVFFLFFMTGIAIVLYLNQPPMQPRERDYAFAGSFYAFAIWIGMGVAGLATILQKPLKEKWAAIAAAAVGLAVPLQMVSQTWDDHDRSGRYAARDFAVNYLESLEPNAIVFCNGDNDTFPLWYAQEVEGIRPDVKIINLSYLASDWYANQQMKQSYEAAPVKLTAKPSDIAYGKADVTVLGNESAPADLLESLKLIYAGKSFNKDYGYPEFPSSIVTIPVDRQAVIKRGLVAPKDSDRIVNEIVIDLGNAPSVPATPYLRPSHLPMCLLIATNAAEGWPRPIYWCSSVGSEYHTGLTNYLVSTGMTHQLVPTMQEGLPARTDRALDVVTKKYLWGGADKADANHRPYFDETARRMLMATRNSMLDVAGQLIIEGDELKETGDAAGATRKYKEALKTLDLMNKNLGEATTSFGITASLSLPDYYGMIAERTGDAKLKKKAADMLYNTLTRLMQYARYNRSIVEQFGQGMSMTAESKLVPYQMHHFIELYERYGGDPKKTDELLKKNGYTREDFRRMYEYAYGSGAEAGEEESYTSDEMLQELKRYAEIVNALAALSPEEYAKRSADERNVDTLYYALIEELKGKGITDEELNSVEEIRKVDLARSKRLTDEYMANHPE